MFHKNLLNLTSLAILLCMVYPAQALDNINQPVMQNDITKTSEENVNLAAAKSFIAWYIKTGSGYDNFDSSWQAWLADPQVPEKFKTAGEDMKETVKNQLAQWQQQGQDLKQKINDITENLIKDLGNSFQKTKEETENAVNNWLEQIITGDKESNTPVN